jgi:hypothetical protein
MKDALSTPLIQALLCILAAAGLYALAGRVAPGEAHDGLIALAGVAGTLWARLPQKPKDGPSAPTLLCLVLALGLTGSACSPKVQQTQMQVAEVATRAANEAGRAMLGLYHEQLGKCVADATNEMEYTICKMAVDQRWGPTRVRFASLRRVQDEYADALERNELRAIDFIEWFRVAYCEFRVNAPKEYKVPVVAGVECSEEEGK